MTLTAERLREILGYDPETGLFTRLVRTGRIRAGEVAGTAHSRGYRSIVIDGRVYLSHRLAWLYVHGEWPPEQIDHINRNRADNRLVNLRAAKQSQNNVRAAERHFGEFAQSSLMQHPCPLNDHRREDFSS
jgi:hypothetical protein